MTPSWLSEYREYIEKMIFVYLDKYIPRHVNNHGLETFKESIYYANQGGKKIRAMLALEFFLALSGKDINTITENDDIIKLIVALELIHSYSLVHDDMPCMDNDEYRRGMKTVWNKYGEYNAILVGDLMNTLAYEIISDMENSEHAIEIIKLFTSNTGFNGMIGGQISDMYFEEDITRISYSDLINLHNSKTGKLIKAAVLSGIILSGKSYKTDEFLRFGEKIGLAFQIKDDILDVEGTFAETGKSVGIRDGGKFEQKGFVYIMGLEKTKMELESLIIDCRNVATKLKSDKLEFLVGYIAERKK